MVNGVLDKFSIRTHTPANKLTNTQKTQYIKTMWALIVKKTLTSYRLCHMSRVINQRHYIEPCYSENRFVYFIVFYLIVLYQLSYAIENECDGIVASS